MLGYLSWWNPTDFTKEAETCGFTSNEHDESRMYSTGYISYNMTKISVQRYSLSVSSFTSLKNLQLYALI